MDAFLNDEGDDLSRPPWWYTTVMGCLEVRMVGEKHLVSGPFYPPCNAKLFIEELAEESIEEWTVRERNVFCNHVIRCAKCRTYDNLKTLAERGLLEPLLEYVQPLGRDK